jgi:hypothetical protein
MNASIRRSGLAIRLCGGVPLLYYNREKTGKSSSPLHRRGGEGPFGIAPFPIPAHQTGRANGRNRSRSDKRDDRRRVDRVERRERPGW